MKNKSRTETIVPAGIIILSLSILSMFVFAGWRITHSASRLAPNVTVESIRAVQNGMTEDEVVAILGYPLERRPSPVPDAVELAYSKPVHFAKWYPMLWVHVRDGVVISVYAKQYPFVGDDVGIYGTVEPDGEARHWETDLFEQSFPSMADG